MFVKTNKGPWVNLNTCRSVEVKKHPISRHVWVIELRSAIILSHKQSVYFIGPYEDEDQAENDSNLMWKALHNNCPTWSPPKDDSHIERYSIEPNNKYVEADDVH